MSANPQLTQQSSIYTLTLDELQNTLGGGGKDFGSMNMDEFLKNIWNAEETQGITSSSNFEINGKNLQKQGSLTLPRTISQKSVDEVWKELLKENGGLKDLDLIKDSNYQPQEKQSTLGEMTLEEFLQKTGVVAENNQTQVKERSRNDGLFGNVSRQNLDQSGFVFGYKNPNQDQGFRQQRIVEESKNEKMENLFHGVRSSSQQPKSQKILPKQVAFNSNAQMGGCVNGVSVSGKINHPIKSSIVRARSPPLDLYANNNLDTSPSPTSYAYGDGGVHARKKSGTLEKVVERRRKRMIKNRESAARSRARKQAYTLELEAEVAKLKELNYELQKKQEEMMESQNSKIPEKMKSWGSRRSCLRRTLTGPW